MAGRRMFSFLSMEKSWSPNQTGNNTEIENKGESRRRLSISRSGRFKEQNRRRTKLNDNVYVPPSEEDKTKSTTVSQEEMESIMAIEKVLPQDLLEDWKPNATTDDLERREATLRKIRTQIRERMETAM